MTQEPAETWAKAARITSSHQPDHLIESIREKLEKESKMTPHQSDDGYPAYEYDFILGCLCGIILTLFVMFVWSRLS